MVGKPEEKNHLEELGIGERIILKWVLKKQDGSTRAAYVWLRSGPCENGNEHVGCIECEEFVNLLTKCWLCKKNCVRWSWLCSDPAFSYFRANLAHLTFKGYTSKLRDSQRRHVFNFSLTSHTRLIHSFIISIPGFTLPIPTAIPPFYV
jgi:hypothetical protein